jgi:5'-nucleotidase
VLHSGTVGAALTGANLGVSGVAVSIAHGADPHFATAAEVGAAALGWVATAPARTVLNVNVPDLPAAGLRGCRWASLAPFGTVRAALRPREDDDGVLAIDLVETAVELPPDSDTALVSAGYVAVTCLAGVRADDWQPAAAEIDRRLVARAAGRRVRPAAGETA